ncbi:DEKNAAC101891 [Brettanomyces naardenensis]|uniref:Spindle pole body component n=1 Tax=Brettanomyces naardenensis TaxID=13370 RepID=A0A448YJA6_BRENA|nr:DEKNAAC101891 [Brettanomyces naardenensis]
MPPALQLKEPVIDNRFSLTARYVKYPPSYKNHEGYPKPKNYPIEKLTNLRDQEAAIIQDLISVLAGFEGFYIRYSEDFDIENVSQRLKGPDFLINKHVDTSFKDITKRVNKLSKMCFALESFVETNNNLIYGRILHSLCYEIMNFLKEYETLLVQIEHEFRANPKYSLTLLEQQLNTGTEQEPVSVSMKMQSFYEITQRINRENDRRSSNSNLESIRFGSIMKSLKDDNYTGTLDGVTSDSENSRFVKGGMVLNMIQRSIDEYKGNLRVHAFLVDLFNRVSKYYLEMLNRWLQCGTVNDPYGEFLINETKSNDHNKFDAIQWADKFSIRQEGLLKQFHAREIQKKIVLTGKYFNVFRECVGEFSEGSDLSNCTISSLQDSDLQIRIEESYKRANKHILEMFFEGYSLDNWIIGLNKYFLLTNGSAFEDFLQFSIKDLRRASDRISLTSLTRSYKRSYEADDSYSIPTVAAKTRRLVYNLVTPVVSSETFVNELTAILKAQTTDADEVFASDNIDSLRELLRTTIETNVMQIQNQLAPPHTRIDKYTIQKFAIDISVPFPLSLILTRSQVFEFQLVFREQSLLRFVDKSLSISWKELCHQRLWKWKYSNRKLTRWISKCRLLHSKMTNFVRILRLYLSFYVIDVNWHKVEEVLDKVGKDETVNLETVYTVIKTFLSTILNDSLLTKLKLVEVLSDIFSVMLLFHNLVMSLQQSLILMDERLFAESQEQLTAIMPEFDEEKNRDRLGKMVATLDSYASAFDTKIGEFASLLNYYGELDSASLLLLYNDLAKTFKLEH